MTTPTQGEHAQPEALRPKFGDLLRNTMASERNPRRDAYFIREVHRSGGGVNPGRWFEMTDGNGETWLSNPQNMVPAAPAQSAAPKGGAYVENPAEIEHVAGDVSKNRAESNMTGGAYAPMQGLSAYLRAEAVGVQGVAAETLRQWAAEVDVASAHALRASHGQAPAGAAPEVDLPDAEDMAHSALQEALSFGLSHDVVYRWMRAIQDQTIKAMAAAAPTAQPAPAAQGDAWPSDDEVRAAYKDAFGLTPAGAIWLNLGILAEAMRTRRAALAQKEGK